MRRRRCYTWLCVSITTWLWEGFVSQAGFLVKTCQYNWYSIKKLPSRVCCFFFFCIWMRINYDSIFSICLERRICGPTEECWARRWLWRDGSLFLSNWVAGSQGNLFLMESSCETLCWNMWIPEMCHPEKNQHKISCTLILYTSTHFLIRLQAFKKDVSVFLQ